MDSWLHPDSRKHFYELSGFTDVLCTLYIKLFFLGIQTPSSLKKTPSVQSEASNNCEHYLRDLKNQLAKVIAANPSSRNPCNEDECEDPKAVPLYWVRYGF